ncbi:hypothetical protein [Fischerella major]|nr:hypothetical protein [Fischerella major]
MQKSISMITGFLLHVVMDLTFIFPGARYKLTASPPQKLSKIMITEPIAAYLHDDKEKVADLAVTYGLVDVPVVDAQGYFLGIVPAQSLISILRQEHIQDLHRLSGIREEDFQARHVLEASPTRRAYRSLTVVTGWTSW